MWAKGNSRFYTKIKQAVIWAWFGRAAVMWGDGDGGIMTGLVQLMSVNAEGHYLVLYYNHCNKLETIFPKWHRHCPPSISPTVTQLINFNSDSATSTWQPPSAQPSVTAMALCHSVRGDFYHNVPYDFIRTWQCIYRKSHNDSQQAQSQSTWVETLKMRKKRVNPKRFLSRLRWNICCVDTRRVWKQT